MRRQKGGFLAGLFGGGSKKKSRSSPININVNAGNSNGGWGRRNRSWGPPQQPYYMRQQPYYMQQQPYYTQPYYTRQGASRIQRGGMQRISNFKPRKRLKKRKKQTGGGIDWNKADKWLKKQNWKTNL